jgi:hypothetical protein
MRRKLKLVLSTLRRLGAAFVASMLITSVVSPLVHKANAAGYQSPEPPPSGLTMTGYGIPTDPFVITNCNQFAEINLHGFQMWQGRHFVLGNDIDCSIEANYRPIDRLVGGSFDGRGHTIDGISLAESNDFDTGLLIQKLEDSSLLNVKVENSALALDNTTYNEYRNIGGLIGKVEDSTVTDVSFSGTIDIPCSLTNSYVGGLVGSITQDSSSSTNIIRSSTSGQIVVDDVGDCGEYTVTTGGISGRILYGNSSIGNSSADMDIDYRGTSQTDCSLYCRVSGGLIGETYTDTSYPISITNSYASGSITVSDDTDPTLSYNLGGLVGLSSSDIVVNNSFSAAAITHSDCGTCNNLSRNTGATIGVSPGGGSALISSAYYDASVVAIGDSDVCIGVETNNDCIAINTVGSPDPGYFSNNSTNAPLDDWDFANFWETTSGLPKLREHVYPTPNPEDLVDVSATNTFPAGSTAIPSGLSNCEGPDPCEPHLVINAPLLSNFCMR